MLVSIYMTMKNASKTLRDTLNSIVNQSYENWELVVVDDGSGDDSTTIIEEDFSFYENKIKLIKTVGIGRAKALNLAVDNCKSSYILNVDADDVWCENKLKKQVEHLIAYSPTIIGTETFIFRDTTRISNIEESSKFSKARNLWRKNVINHSSVLIDRSKFGEGALYDESLKCNIDYDLWLKAVEGKAVIHILGCKLTGKRIHENQSFENKTRMIYLKQNFKLKRAFINRNFNGRRRFFEMLFAMMVYLYGFIPQGIRVNLK